MREIASAASLSRAALHLHFRDRFPERLVVVVGLETGENLQIQHGRDGMAPRRSALMRRPAGREIVNPPARPSPHRTLGLPAAALASSTPAWYPAPILKRVFGHAEVVEILIRDVLPEDARRIDLSTLEKLGTGFVGEALVRRYPGQDVDGAHPRRHRPRRDRPSDPKPPGATPRVRTPHWCTRGFVGHFVAGSVRQASLSDTCVRGVSLGRSRHVTTRRPPHQAAIHPDFI